MKLFGKIEGVQALGTGKGDAGDEDEQKKLIED